MTQLGDLHLEKSTGAKWEVIRESRFQVLLQKQGTGRQEFVSYYMLRREFKAINSDGTSRRA